MSIGREGLVDKERRPEDMRYLCNRVLCYWIVQWFQVFDDFGVAFESSAEDFPDFAETARKRMSDFPRRAKDY